MCGRERKGIQTLCSKNGEEEKAMQKFHTVSRTGTRNDDGPLLPHFETSSSKRKDMENNRVRSLATSNSPSSQLRCKSDKPSFVPLKKKEKARCMVDDLGSLPDAAVMIRKKVLPLFPVLSSRLSPSWASPPAARSFTPSGSPQTL